MVTAALMIGGWRL